MQAKPEVLGSGAAKGVKRACPDQVQSLNFGPNPLTEVTDWDDDVCVRCSFYLARVALEASLMQRNVRTEFGPGVKSVTPSEGAPSRKLHFQMIAAVQDTDKMLFAFQGLSTHVPSTLADKCPLRETREVKT
ncbi:MAG: hypothetical protein JWO94_3799 [Verrucomicrobiaceae bacterium]|nr:hypothetical protein [Verrucomicrobiaceae bacterium]